jgi:hypothetical protein
MNISGTTSICQIQSNKPFVKSGSTSMDLSSIYITNETGMDISGCYVIDNNINPITTEETCNASIEIVISQGIANVVSCDYTGYTQQADGLILAEYSGNTTTLNVHPECCTSLGFTSELGVDNYYVCRWKTPIDPNDCNNYTSTNEFDINNYLILNYIEGGTTNTVPNAECCYNIGLIEEVSATGIHCIEEIPPACDGYTFVSVPLNGDATFINNSTNTETTIVPSSECCTTLDNPLNFKLDTNGVGYNCYSKLTVVKPTANITMQSECCLHEPTVTVEACKQYRSAPYDDRITVTYIDCNGVQRTQSSTCFSTICRLTICARSIVSSTDTMNIIGDC